MKERKKTTLHLQEIHSRCRVLVFFHLCLVSVLFSSPSLLEMNFFPETFFPSFCSFGGVSKPTSKRKRNTFIASDEIVSGTHLRK